MKAEATPNSRRSVCVRGAACLAGLLALSLGGCSTPATRINAAPETFARLAFDVQAAVRAGQVGLGFRPEAVRLALGEPTRIVHRTENDGEIETWHYFTYESSYLSAMPEWGSAYLGEPAGRRIRDWLSVEFRGGMVTAIVTDRTN
jgi:hypothetical protein